MVRRFILALLLLAALPREGSPAATVDLSWNQCSPVVSAASSDPANPVSTLYVTARDWSEPHTSYVVRLWFGGELPCREMTTSTPDAWRFDADGCNAGRLETFLAFASKACSPAAPAMGGSWNGHFVHYTAGSDFYAPTGSMRFVMFRNYAAVTPDPASRYLLVGIRFDHSASIAGPGTPGVSCGGLETPLCVALWPYQRPTVLGPGCQDDVPEPDFDSAYIRSSDNTAVAFAHGQGWASFNVAGTFGCFQATPARDATWGAIKAQYR